ncbi:MAG: hypothetical protein VST68_02165, partial [Nitrospirota bacterium]|nr:hypothetical protein [Nitrospirota bacterium]
MGRKSNILTVTVLAGVALLLGQGCSSKAFRAMVGSESMDSTAEFAENEMGQRDPHSGYLQDGTWDVAREPNDGYQQDGVWDVAQGRFVRPNSVDGYIQQNPGGFPPLRDDSKKFEESMALLPDFGTSFEQPGDFEEGGPLAEEFVQGNMVAEAQPSFDSGDPSDPGPSSNARPSSPNYPIGTEDYPTGMPGNPPSMQEYSSSFDQNAGPEGHKIINVELQDVFFQLDSWNVSQDGAQALVHDASWLGENDERSLTIEGHCDQRGTADYNIALG